MRRRELHDAGLALPQIGPDRSFLPGIDGSAAQLLALRLGAFQPRLHPRRLPFDIHQMRTIVIDNRDIYSLVPKIETYRSEIASQVRRALAPEADVDTPLSVHFPSLVVSHLRNGRTSSLQYTRQVHRAATSGLGRVGKETDRDR
jgi:hypothetical protein